VLRSMTGYGSSERADGGRRIRVELKSVNQRFLDIQIKAPRLLLQVEDKIRRAIESSLGRGRVTVYVEWRDESGAGGSVLNREVAWGLVRELRDIKETLALPGEIDLSVLSRFPQVFETTGETPAADEVWQLFEPALTEALAGLVTMRETEGAKLADDLTERTGAIKSIVKGLESSAPEALEASKQRFRERLTALMEDMPRVDETRIAQEVVMAAERSDFTEELVRLGAHLSHAHEVIAEGGPVGKRLNFLVQEMHREANTIGSKSVDIGVSNTVVSLKEEVEKLREQVQNVE